MGTIKNAIARRWKTFLIKKGGEHYYPLQLQGKQPFCIVSPGRTGSTLLRKMLIVGKEVHIPPESDDFIPKIITDHLLHSRLSWVAQCESMSTIYQQSELRSHWKIKTEDYREFLLETPIHHQNLYTKIWSLHHLHQLKFAPDAELFGDKTPLLSEWAEWIHIVSPGTPYIFLVRNIFDTVASRKRSFGEELKTAFDRYANAWKAMRKFSKLHPELVKQIRYEDLTANTEVTLKEVCSHLDISFHSHMLHPENASIGEEQMAHHEKLNQKVNTLSIGKGLSELSEQEVKQLKRWCKSAGIPEELYQINR